ncbi:MAG: type II toxin-antitoxin system RelE/ParE family toxin [Rhodospirillaceae bacterium]
MNIRSVRHKALLRFLETDDARGLPSDHVPRLRNIISVLLSAPDMGAVAGPPGWRIHQLKGVRAGAWSISVSGNWRLTFRLNEQDIHDLDYEDYH